MKHFRWFSVILSTLAVVALFNHTATPLALAQGSSRTCRTSFEFSVTSGPSAPLTLLGMLTLNINNSGAITGSLEGYKGKLVTKGNANIPNRVNVMGQANGHAISLMIALPGGQKVYGTGVSEGNFSTCSGVIKGQMGGPAVGPGVGDQGDWRRQCPPDYDGRPSEC